MNKQTKIPLSELITQLYEKLHELRYGDNSIYSFRIESDKLIQYSKGVSENYMTQELQSAFLRDAYNSNQKERFRRARRFTDMLLSLQENGEIYSRRPINKSFPKGLADIYEEYHKIMHGQVRKSSQKTYHRALRISAEYLADNGINDIALVTKDTVANFTITLSRFDGKSAKKVLRLFAGVLKYAYEQGITQDDLSKCCMNVRFYKGEKIPPTFTKDEIERILSAVDRSTTVGKRDYAMLMLVSRTGLRRCDIINLKLSNLRFDTDTIEIVQQKTGKFLVLPMTEEIGLAFVDYFKNGRPDVGSEYVFLRHRAPFEFLKTVDKGMVARYMSIAGIEKSIEKTSGFRIFRHSLASMMLECNVPIYQIKEDLGHENINTTMRYVKIDKSSLQQCALEVPSVRH